MPIITSISRAIVGSDPYYEQVTTDYDNGNQDIIKRLLGAESELTGVYEGKIRQVAAEFATYMRGGSFSRQVIADMITLDGDIVTIGADSAIAQLATNDSAYLEASGWTIYNSSTTLDLVFTVTSGAVTYAIDGGSLENAYYFGDVLRLYNYPSSPGIADLFRLEDGTYVNHDRSVIITPP